MRGCRVAASLACLLVSAALITLFFITMVEKMAPDDYPDDLIKMPPFPADPSLLYDLTNFSYVIEPPDCSNRLLGKSFAIDSNKQFLLLTR